MELCLLLLCLPWLDYYESLLVWSFNHRDGDEKITRGEDVRRAEEEEADWEGEVTELTGVRGEGPGEAATGVKPGGGRRTATSTGTMMEVEEEALVVVASRSAVEASGSKKDCAASYGVYSRAVLVRRKKSSTPNVVGARPSCWNCMQTQTPQSSIHTIRRSAEEEEAVSSVEQAGRVGVGGWE